MGIEPIEHTFDLEFDHHQTKKKLVKEIHVTLEESCQTPYYVKKHNIRKYHWSKLQNQKVSIYFFDKMDYSYFRMKTA